MGKIFYIMGKSASGKDSFFRCLREDASLGLSMVTLYTTRPMRSNEAEGREYFFRDEAFYRKMQEEGRVIEGRTYQTVCGPWSYFTLDDGQISVSGGNYLMIGTLESYVNTKKYFEAKGMDILVPVYIYVEDGERILRAVRREQSQEKQNYAELCRRFLADEADFSEEKIREAGIFVRYENQNFETCLSQVRDMILGHVIKN